MSYSQQGPSRRNVHHQAGGNSFSMDFDANFAGPEGNADVNNWQNSKPMDNFVGGPMPSMNPNSFYQPGPPPPAAADYGYPGMGQAPSMMRDATFSSPPPQPPFQSQSFNPAASMMNQQFLMAAGQQLLSNEVAAAAVATYSQSLMSKGLGWAEKVKFYFGVDTSYVVKKLMLIFLPFLHTNWTIRYNSENVLPKDEPNLPDLYIPSMAFITYVLLSGYILGLQNSFAPEKLSMYAGSALAWLFLEVIIIQLGKYFLQISSILGFFHLIAFGGYKFVSIVFILLASIAFGSTGYYVLFVYSMFSLGYFLLRSLNSNLQMSNTASYRGAESPRSNQYLVLLVCFIQPIVVYFLTHGFLK